MISLFIDTSLANVSISIIKDNKILSSIKENIPNMHSIYTVSYIEKVLKESKVNSYDIDNIYVVEGPGSFTGIRIGITIAKTLGFLIKRDIIPVSSLKMLAISSPNKDIIMSIIPANKSNYYVGLYDKEYNSIIKEEFMNIDKVNTLINEYNPYIVSSNILEKIDVNVIDLDIIKIIDYYKDKDKVNCYKLVPNYLKLPQAVEDKKC